MANPSGRIARHHPAVSDVLSTLADTIAALDDVQRRLELEFRASYPDHVNPVNLVARVERIQENVSSLKKLCRNLLIQKQELMDKMRASVASQRRATQRLLAVSGLPPLSEADVAAVNSVNEVIDEWTAHVRPVIEQDSMEDPNKILFDALI